MPKLCRCCKQPIHEKPVKEDQSRNGVSVIVHRFKNGSTIVDASCSCFGSTWRLHNNAACPVLKRQLARRRVA